MKKNNKGFMLFETLIVSTFVLGTLIFLFLQFSNVRRNYDISFKYNTIPGLYKAKIIENYLRENGFAGYVSQLTYDSSGYIKIDCATYSGTLCSKIIDNINAKVILFTGYDITNLQNHLKTVNYDKTIFDEELKRFILSLPTTLSNQKNRLIIEYNDNTFATISIGDTRVIDEYATVTINYLLLNDSGTYDLKESEIVSWPIGYYIRAKLNTYEGYTSPIVSNVLISGDTQIDYKYDK